MKKKKKKKNTAKQQATKDKVGEIERNEIHSIKIRQIKSKLAMWDEIKLYKWRLDKIDSAVSDMLAKCKRACRFLD